MGEVRQQIETGLLTLGEITDVNDLTRNLTENAVPEDLDSVTAGTYGDFLVRRRRLMAELIHRYYDAL